MSPAGTPRGAAGGWWGAEEVAHGEPPPAALDASTVLETATVASQPGDVSQHCEVVIPGTRSDGTLRIFLYDAKGERVATYVDGEGLYYTFRDLDGSVVREVFEGGAQTTTYRSTKDYAWRDGKVLGSYNRDVGIRHYHLDHLGTPRLITDRCGTVKATHAYLPFGEEATATNQDSEAMKFHLPLDEGLRQARRQGAGELRS